jgi:hypothetical protein
MRASDQALDGKPRFCVTRQLDLVVLRKRHFSSISTGANIFFGWRKDRRDGRELELKVKELELKLREDELKLLREATSPAPVKN